jgi:transcriptional regulator with XRE-family HTH domain
MVSITPGQCRAARALLGWSQAKLEERSRVSKKTIADFERGVTSPQARTLDDLEEAFDDAGIEFLPLQEGEHGHGVRFRSGFTEPSRDEIEVEGATEAKKPRKPVKGAEEMEAFWLANPSAWAALSQTGRYVISREIYGTPEAGDEAFGSSPSPNHSP